jgi:RHS repeat-associated protein
LSAGRSGYGGGSVRQRYTGKERDDESGLDFFGARYYHSSVGRFTSCDPVGFTKSHLVNPQRWNLYIYVINSPLSLRDPDGKQDEGVSGSRVIDVFIPDPNLIDVQKVKSAVEEIRRKTFIEINIFAGEDAGLEAVYKSLQRAGGTTILATHTWAGPKYGGNGGPFIGDAIWLRDGFLGGKGLANTEGENKHTGFRIKAENLIVISCNLMDGVAATIAKRLTTKTGNFVYSTGGGDGECSASAATDVTIAAVQALAKQKAVSPFANNIDPVIKAMEGAIFSHTPPPEEQDRLKVLHGPSDKE